MRLSTIGIILLTVMVATKYFISMNTLRAEDGSFKTGVIVDYSIAIDNLNNKKSILTNDNLLAFNSSTHFKTIDDKSVYNHFLTTNNFSSNSSTETKSERTNLEEPLPMEYGNTLVVYDFSNPDNNLVSSNYEDIDIEDDIPLDNGNTIINGLMLIMPRR